MRTRSLVLSTFAIGLGVGAIVTSSLGPLAEEDAGISASDVDGLDERIRAIAEECVITVTGASFAHLTCRRDAFERERQANARP